MSIVRGNRWYNFSIKEPQAMSRVFNPLTRYKLYGRLDNNADWAIDFDKPRREVWRYVLGEIRRRPASLWFRFHAR